MPPIPAGGGERPVSVGPEDLRAAMPGETVPEVRLAPAGPEAAPAPGPSPVPTTAALPPTSQSAALPNAAMPVSVPTPVAQSQAPTPATAADEDVIEPEWVDKAEDVIKAHAGDPYGEEEGVTQLQEDYLQKRYGIGVKDADNKGGSGSNPTGA